MREKPRYKHKQLPNDVFLGHYGDYDLWVYTYPDKTIGVPFYKNADDTMTMIGRETLKNREYNIIVKECLHRACKLGCKNDPVWL